MSEALSSPQQAIVRDGIALLLVAVAVTLAQRQCLDQIRLRVSHASATACRGQPFLPRPHQLGDDVLQGAGDLPLGIVTAQP